MRAICNANYGRPHFWWKVIVAEAYRAAATLEPKKAEWHRKFWVCAHRAGRKQEALDALHGWLEGVDMRKFGGILLRQTHAAARHLNDVDRSLEFVQSLADRLHPDDATSRSRLAVLGWLLGLPTQVDRLVQQPDAELLSTEVQECLRAFRVRAAHDTFLEPRVGQPESQALVYWNHNTDERVLLDLARSFGRMTIVAPPTACDKLPPSLRSAVELVSARSNVPVDSVLDNLMANLCAEVAREAMAGLVNTLGSSLLGDAVRMFAPALQLAFEDRLYDLGINATSLALFSEQLQPDTCIAVTGEDLPSEVFFPLSRAASVICAPNVFHHMPGSLRRAKPGEAESPRPDVREVAQGLWAQLQKETTALFHAKSSQVGILTNFSPSDFRIAPAAPAIVRAISRRQPCILLQRTNVKPVSEQAIRKFLGADNAGNADSHCRLWAGLEGIWRQANQTSGDFGALRSAMMAGVQGSPAHDLELSRGGLSGAVIQNAVDLFLARDFRPLLLLGLSARQTFRQNRLASLLIIPEDRNPVSRVFTLAAQEHGIPVYNYSYFFLSRYVRYKRPLSDYVFVPSTYHADYFQMHFGLAPSQLIRVGSHAIAARLQEARSLDPLACRQRMGQFLPRPLIVFFSQPRLFEKSSMALSWLLAAAAQVDAEVAVRLHPGERHLASEYEQVIKNKNVSDRAWVDHSDASVTEVLLAANIVATMWSNVGLEAAALNCAVLAIKIDKNPPIDLAGMGVAIGADSEESVGKIVSELLNGGAASSQLGCSRQHFFDRNPELLAGEVEDRIAETICRRKATEEW
jgi:hypothetical protein